MKNSATELSTKHFPDIDEIFYYEKRDLTLLINEFDKIDLPQANVEDRLFKDYLKDEYFPILSLTFLQPSASIKLNYAIITYLSDIQKWQL
jgi:hypothetical protein